MRLKSTRCSIHEWNCCCGAPLNEQREEDNRVKDKKVMILRESIWEIISNLIMYRPVMSLHTHTHTHTLFIHIVIRLH